MKPRSAVSSLLIVACSAGSSPIVAALALGALLDGTGHGPVQRYGQRRASDAVRWRTTGFD